MKKIFNLVEPAYHRLEKHNIKSARYRTETISHLDPKIWNLLPEEYKETESIFKRKFSNQDSNECPCVKTYIQHLGFI